MRIAYLGNANEPHFQEWIPALQKVGISIDFISYEVPKNPIPAVTYHSLPFRRKLSWKHFCFGDKNVLKNILKNTNPDAIIASNATNYGLLAQRVNFHPCLIQTWTWDLTILPNQGLKRFVFKPIVQKVLNYADIITTDGNALLKMGKAIFPKAASKMVATTWGIRVQDFLDENTRNHTFKIPENAILLTWARGIDSIYQPEIGLPALLKTVENNENVWALILGLGHQPSIKTQQILANCKQNPRIIVIENRIPKAEMQGIWEQTDFMISMPIADGISEALLEGMLCGAIPIVNDIPSNRAFLSEENAIFATETQLQAAFQSAIDISEKWKTHVIQNNKTWVIENASQEKTALQIKELLDKIVSST